MRGCIERAGYSIYSGRVGGFGPMVGGTPAGTRIAGLPLRIHLARHFHRRPRPGLHPCVQLATMPNKVASMEPLFKTVSKPFLVFMCYMCITGDVLFGTHVRAHWDRFHLLQRST